MFTPFAGKIVFERIEQDSVILQDGNKYEEMGRVVQVGEGVTFVKEGDVIFFLAYGVEQTPKYNGQNYYVVPCDAKFLIGKICETNPSATEPISTTIESPESSTTESKRFAVDAKIVSSSTVESQTGDTSSTICAK